LYCIYDTYLLLSLHLLQVFHWFLSFLYLNRLSPDSFHRLHFLKYFLHVQILLLQTPWQLHGITLSRSCGAGSKSLAIGIYTPFDFLQHQCSGFKLHFGSFHCCTCKKTRMLWYSAEEEVGGRENGSTWYNFIDTKSKNFVYLILSRVLSPLTWYNIMIVFSPAFMISVGSAEDYINCCLSLQSSEELLNLLRPIPFAIPWTWEVVLHPVKACMNRRFSVKSVWRHFKILLTDKFTFFGELFCGMNMISWTVS